jgi:mono/diheme cytochrome c family protein
MNALAKRAANRALLALALCGLAAAASAQDFSQYTGADLYKRFCASCHGPEGRGDGPVAATFKAQVPDLTRLARRAGDAFPEARVRRIVDGRDVPAPHGARGMPVWGTEFTAAATPGGENAATTLIDRLVAFLRSMQTQAPM